MKKRISVLLMAALLLSVLVGCHREELPSDTTTAVPTTGQAFGDSLEDLEAYEGYFDEDIADVTVTCISGTEGCYTLQEGVLRFSGVQQDSVYAISGKLKGSIVIDIDRSCQFDLELQGFSLVSDLAEPVSVLGGDKVSITAKSGYQNYIYDMRAAVDDEDEQAHSAAVYATVDLELCGKGQLKVVSENNNGIHTKDDLVVKNLTLLVYCVDNALKGNDSVRISGGDLTLIATAGDGIKTKNTDVSAKGNQRGTVTISDGSVAIYAACDGIDAAYDVTIDSDTAQVNIYTSRYSNYSQISDVPENAQQPGQQMPPDKGEMPDMGERPDMGDIPPRPGESRPSQTIERKGEFMGGGPGGMGGHGDMNAMEGNPNKSETSAKGIKAGNQITVNAGLLTINAYDDCLHANGGTALENGETSLGNVTINGGILTLYSDDDGVHADNILAIDGGSVSVTHSYEGLEGERVQISGGTISVAATDDGINGTATSGTAIAVSGGQIYVYCSGDGLDSNSKDSYTGIRISGGNMVVISNGSGDSAIDTEQGYTFSGGNVIAIMPSRGMTSELTRCKDFSALATKSTLNFSTGKYLTVTAGENTVATVKIPESMSAMVVYLGTNSAKFQTENSVSLPLDGNGVWWNI